MIVPHVAAQSPFYTRCFKDMHTCKTAQCVISNIFLKCALVSFPYSGLLTLPIRLSNCITVFRRPDRKQHLYKVAFDVAALAVSAFPYGYEAAIAIDCAAEAIHQYRKYKLPPKPDVPDLDPPPWCDFHATKLVQCIAAGVFLQITQIPFPYSVLLTVPLRVYNIAQAVRNICDQDGIRVHSAAAIVFDIMVAGFLAYPDPWTPLGSAISDCIGEAVRRRIEYEFRHPMYQRPESVFGIPVFQFRDVSTVEGALGQLSLTSEEAQDLEVVTERYVLIRDNWLKRVRGFEALKRKWPTMDDHFIRESKLFVDHVERAYKTLCDELHRDP